MSQPAPRIAPLQRPYPPEIQGKHPPKTAGTCF